MLFCEKVDNLLRALAVPRAVLAREAGLDASLVSRFMKGERVPSRFSPQLERLAAGAAALAVQQKRTREVCALCGISHTEEAPLLFDAIYAWIHLEESGLRPQRAHQAKEPARPQRALPRGDVFADRLEALMTAASVSNVQLARYLNADAALIGRYRAGVRSPAPSGRIVSEICMYFSMLKCAPEERAALCALVNTPYTEDPETFFDAVRVFLKQPGIAAERILADALLETVDLSVPVQARGNAAGGPIPAGAYMQPAQIYTGNEGLRAAALRLLRETIAAGRPAALYLYTELPLSWMLEDDAFMEEWPRLMREALLRGVSVRLVLNFDRDISETVRNLGRWLPLLRAGDLETYCCVRLRDRRFNFTLMGAEGVAGVASFSVTGAGASAQYLFVKDPAVLEGLGAQFLTLLRNNCARLCLFGAGREREYLARLSAFERAPGDTDVLLHALSHYTMPYELMQSILARAGADKGAAEETLRYHEVSAKRTMKNLAQYNITDFISLPSPEELKNGGVAVSFPGLGIGKDVYYTPAEYAAHIRVTLRLLREFPRYSVFLLPQPPYRNINVMVRQGAGTLISRGGDPALAVLFDHLSLNGAVTDYMDMLRLRSVRVYPGRGQGYAQMWRFLQEPKG